MQQAAPKAQQASATRVRPSGAAAKAAVAEASSIRAAVEKMRFMV